MKQERDIEKFLAWLETANMKGYELEDSSHNELIEAWKQAKKDMGLTEDSFDWAESCEEHDEILRNLERDDESNNDKY